MPITIMDVLFHHEPALKDQESVSMGDFDRHNLPFFCGCSCTASLAAYNAYPSKTGYTMCKDCIGDRGFENAEEFEAFMISMNAEPDGDDYADRAEWDSRLD